MLQWLATIGKPDLRHTLNKLNRFGIFPHKNHFNLAVRIFGYLDQVLSLVITIDSRPLEYNHTTNYEKLILDFLQDYAYVYEELND